MEKEQIIIKKYNDLIKVSVKIRSTWSRSNFKFKQYQIDNCDKDVEFYKMMKKKIKNGFLTD